MNEFIEKLIKKLYESVKRKNCPDEACWEHLNKNCDYCDFKEIKVQDAISIVNQLAEEYGKDINVTTNNGWISVNDRLPSEEQKVIACINPSIAKHEIILIPYESWNICWRDGSIIAWMPLPEPYRPKGE